MYRTFGKKSRNWYIESCVTDNDRSRLLQLTAVPNILEKTADGTTYTIEYNREMNGIINYNQLTYTLITLPENEFEAYLMAHE